MRGLRRDRILVGTALAFVLASPLAARAQEAGQAQFAAVPVEAPALQPSPAASAESAPPANAEKSPANTTEPAAKPDATAALDPADQAIAEKIREVLITADSDRIFSSGEERQKVEAFYQQRQFAPLWLDKGVESANQMGVEGGLLG